jgi:hypothetical protein
VSQEIRSIWLVTKAGVPQYCRWALVREPSEVQIPDEASAFLHPAYLRHFAALDQAQADDPEFDAVRTEWRRVPELVQPGLVDVLPGSVDGRDVVIAGCRFSMDTRGKARPAGEPDEPGGLVEDDEALVAAAELVGRDIRLTDRSSGGRLRASPDGAAASQRGGEILLRRNGAAPERVGPPVS